VRPAHRVAFVLTFAAGCNGLLVSETTQPAHRACTEPVAEYCTDHPGTCPPSGDRCGWLAGHGLAGYGGPIECRGLGEGWGVQWPSRANDSYIFDDAGDLVAIFDDHGCRAGPESLPDAGCIDLRLLFGCPTEDAGNPDSP
jgi:hypothetical protein